MCWVSLVEKAVRGRQVAANIEIIYLTSFTMAEVFQLTEASAEPVRSDDARAVSENRLTYTMPPMSVSTLVFE